jgi:hypothetical protein
LDVHLIVPQILNGGATMNITTKLSLLLCLATTPLCAEPKKLLLLETANQPDQNYSVLIQLCKAAGFTTDYSNFYHVSKISLEKYDAVFLVMDDSFFDKEVLVDPYIEYTLQKLHLFGQLPHKLIGMLLPKSTNNTERYVNPAKELINQFFLNTEKPSELTNKQAVEPLLNDCLHWFLQSTGLMSYWYDTALLYKNPKRAEKLVKSSFKDVISRDNKQLAYCLCSPIHRGYNNNPFPLGLIIDTTPYSSLLFISKLGLLNFNEIEDNFRINPIDPTLRQQLLTASLNVLCQVYALCSDQTQTANPKLPYSLTAEHMAEHKATLQRERNKQIDSNKYSWIIRDGVNGAWLDLDPYGQNDQIMSQGVQTIIDARLNFLWITVNPEKYLSVNALEPEQTQICMEILEKFTTLLYQESIKAHLPLPHVCINFDITTNYKIKPVNRPVIDLFGKIYSKIPSPLDYDHFWHLEVIQPFDRFLELWNKHCLLIPLAGVFFDLELYHAQDEASEYTTIMDFSDISWHTYCSEKKLVQEQKLQETRERVIYLIERNLIEDYQTVLRNSIENIARRIRTHIRTKLPKALLGLYTMTLPQTWFAQGFLAGLGTPQDPVIYATFNHDIYTHGRWIQDNHFNFFHMAVLLLSKFQTNRDFALINQLKIPHDGIWYNRFSHLVETFKEGDWWDLERSPLEPHNVTKAIAQAFTS